MRQFKITIYIILERYNRTASKLEYIYSTSIHISYYATAAQTSSHYYIHMQYMITWKLDSNSK